MLSAASEELICDYFDFVPFDPGSVSPIEQFAVFSKAKVIIGAHGAGLTNIVSCKTGTKLIELNFRHDVRWHYFRMSCFLNLDHSLLLSANRADDEIAVNLDELSTVLGLR